MPKPIRIAAVLLLGIVAACGPRHERGEHERGEGGGGGRAQGIRMACHADIEKYCGNFETHKEQRHCLMQNRDKVSPDCQTALDAARERQRERRQERENGANGNTNNNGNGNNNNGKNNGNDNGDSDNDGN